MSRGELDSCSCDRPRSAVTCVCGPRVCRPTQSLGQSRACEPHVCWRALLLAFASSIAPCNARRRAGEGGSGIRSRLDSWESSDKSTVGYAAAGGQLGICRSPRHHAAVTASAALRRLPLLMEMPCLHDARTGKEGLGAGLVA